MGSQMGEEEGGNETGARRAGRRTDIRVSSTILVLGAVQRSGPLLS